MEVVMDIIKKLLKEQSGQTATEYMVLLGSVVAVVLGAAYTFKDKFSTGVTSMSENVNNNLSQGFK